MSPITTNAPNSDNSLPVISSDAVKNQTPPAKQNGRSGLKRLGLRILFSSIATAALLLLLESLLFAFGVKPVFYDDPFVGFTSGSPLFRETTENDGRAVYTTSPNKLTWFNQQSFAKKKDAGTYRIFCLGGSTTVGRPYDDKTSFARWLREFTAEADPDQKIEVINAGGISYASYRIARLMAELAQYEPDMFIVYTGHNEFLEHQTYGSLRDIPAPVRNLASLLGHTRIYSAVHRFANSTADTKLLKKSGRTVLSPEVDAVLDRTIGPETYTRNDKFQTLAITHFASTLNRLIDIANDAGAEIVFVEPSSNLRDCSPFKSQHRPGLTETQLANWQSLASKAQQSVDENDFPAALAALDKAAQLDDRVADLHYRRGRILWNLQQFADAKAAYIRARDEDVCPLRALSAMVQALSEVTHERKVRLIPFARVVDSQAVHGVPGSDWFLDHVHPTIAGHQLLADLILQELIDRHVIKPNSLWSETARQRVIDRVESTLDRHDHALALRNLSKVLEWAGKFEDADRLALQAVAGLPNDHEAQFQAGNAEARRQNHNEAIAYFSKTVQLHPSHAKALNNLGDQYVKLGKLETAVEYFERSIEIDPGFINGYNNVGVVYRLLGKPGKAELVLQRALRLAPGRFDVNYTLGSVYFDMGRYYDAERHLQQAVAARPDNMKVRQELSTVRQHLR